MLRKRRLDARNEIAAIGLIIDVLKLAPAALRKVTAWRHLVVRPFDEGVIVADDVAGHAEGHMLSR
jgi:hypothetical protein